ncbi:sugar ABC transporter permease [Catellatospora vulcania]|uniref:sugar ABC transporter permease n=1 Tax=Catellatospora vulcania TaxID=1460450 RepID=UPI0018AF9B1E|nr:sugar ABC transporter permease [Catellatospora vulcania]
MTETAAKTSARQGSVLFGLLAVIPAFVLLCSGYVVPTVRTVLAGFTDVDMLGKESESVGLENYSDVFSDFAESLVWPLIFAVLVTLTAVGGGGTLAYLAARAGRAGRWTARIAFALPMAAVATAGAAAAWVLTYERSGGLNPLFAQYLTFFGLAVGLGATAYLLVFRRSTRPRDAWSGVLLVSGAIAASSLAIGLQAFGFPYLLGRTPDGPRFATPALLIFQHSFQTFRLGTASAAAVLLWLPLVALGIGIALWLILTRARIVPADQPSAEQTTAPAPADNLGWRVISFIVTGGLLLLGLAGLTPWLLNSVGFDTEAVRGNLFTHLSFTWLPPLISTVVGVLAAALAGYGIGALRPLGDRSELLLLPFAPWLFVGLAGLTPDAFLHRTEDGSEFLFLIPPASLAIPVLFASTLLFRGVRWTRALPVVGLAALLTWVVQAQDTLWPILAGFQPDSAPMQVVVMQTIQEFRYRGDGGVPTGWLYPLPVFLLVAAAIAAAQVLVLDRLALRTGRTVDTDQAVAAPVSTEDTSAGQ